MRLIDADALMTKFAERVKRSNESDFAKSPTWNDAVSLVECEPTAGGWIPCSEKLPETCGKYLVTMKWNDDDGEHIVIKATWYKKWDDIGWGWAEIFDVIAWQPLPSPYGGE